jgi:hypothetical protein
VGSPTSIGLSRATSYNNMANVLVAIAFLMVGVERVQKLGVKGGDYIQKGLDFGKNVATIATGIKAAQWTGGKAWGGAKAGSKMLGKEILEGTRIPHVLRQAKEGFKQGRMETNIPLLSSKGSIKRAGELERWKERTKIMEQKLASEGGRGSDINAQLLQSKKDMARENVLVQNEKRRDEGEIKEVEGKFRVQIFNDEKKEFKKNVETAETAWRTANTGVPLDDKTRAEIAHKVLDDMGAGAATLQALRAEARSKAAGGLAAKEIDRNMYADFDDMERAKANKMLKAKRLAMMQDSKEDMDDFGGASYNLRAKLLRDEHKKMVAARTAALARGEDPADDADFGASQKKVQTLVTVAAENGELSGMMSEVLGKQHRNPGATLNSSAAVAGSLLALQTGRDINDLLKVDPVTGETQTDSTAAQEEEIRLRKSLGEKAEAKQGMLAVAMDNGAGKKNEWQYYNQMIEGYDADGALVRGVLAKNAIAGDRSTVAGQYVTGGTSDGTSMQSGTESHIRSNTTSISEVKDARSQIGVNSEGHAVAALSKDSEKLLLGIATKTAAEIGRLAPNITNLMSGGKYSESGYNGTDSLVYAPGSEKMMDTMKDLLRSMKKRVDDSTSAHPGSPEESRNKEALAALMNKITGQTRSYEDNVRIKIQDSSGMSVRIDSL